MSGCEDGIYLSMFVENKSTTYEFRDCYSIDELEKEFQELIKTLRGENGEL